LPPAFGIENALGYILWNMFAFEISPGLLKAQHVLVDQGDFDMLGEKLVLAVVADHK
jgi:hypothetical protein